MIKKIVVYSDCRLSDVFFGKKEQSLARIYELMQVLWM